MHFLHHFLIVFILLLHSNIAFGRENDDYTSELDFLFEDDPLPTKMRINVALLGFDRDGAFEYVLNTERFQMLLEDLLPSHQPYCLETQSKLNINFQFDYNVKKIPVARYEQGLAQTIRAANAFHGDQEVDVYSIGVTKNLNDYFNGLLADHSPSEGTQSSMGEYSIFILNPNKANLFPKAANEPKFIYNFFYANSTTPSQQWISDHRYLVVDLSAGPTKYGGSDVGEGAIGDATIPRLEHYLIKGDQRLSSSAEVEAQLSALIINAIRHVFVPDIEFEATQHADKVLIPIIIMRNHNYFNPLDVDTEYSIDMKAVEREVKKLFLPTQEVLIVGSVHGLHEHKHLSMAVAKARRTDTSHEMKANRRFGVRYKSYLDSDTLMHEFKHVEDLLGSGLISLSNLHKSTFFNTKIPDVVIDGDKVRSKTRGTVVLPVYVLSLVGMEPNITLTGNSLLTTSSETVIVLQTNDTGVPLPYFSHDKKVHINPRNPTRHIIAGISHALGGIVEPMKRYSPLHSKVLKDYTWAMGHHPFGPFTNNTELSQIYVDMVLRNTVISRANTAIRTIKESIAEVDEFAKEYLWNPFDQNVTHKEGASWRNWIDILHHHPIPDAFSPIAATTVYELHQEIKEMEKQLLVVARYLHDYNLEEAHKISAAMEVTAMGFKNYVNNQIDESEGKLLCCFLRHEVISDSTESYTNMISLLLSAIIVFAAVLFIVRKGQKKIKK